MGGGWSESQVATLFPACLQVGILSGSTLVPAGESADSYWATVTLLGNLKGVELSSLREIKVDDIALTC